MATYRNGATAKAGDQVVLVGAVDAILSGDDLVVDVGPQSVRVAAGNTQPIASIGGGGAANIVDLDDVDSGEQDDGKLLVFDDPQQVHVYRSPSEFAALPDHDHEVWSRQFWDHFEYFEGNRYDSVATGGASAYHQNAATLSQLDDKAQLGVYRVSCGGGSVGDYASLNFQEVGQLGRLLSSVGTWRVRARLCTINDANLKAAFGLAAADATTLRPTNSATFEFDANTSANIRAVTNDGTTPNDVDTTQAIATIDTGGTGNWRWFEFECRAGRIRQLVDGVVRATHTTNLPAAANTHWTPYVYAEHDGSGFRSLLVDYWDVLVPAEMLDAGGY